MSAVTASVLFALLASVQILQAAPIDAVKPKWRTPYDLYLTPQEAYQKKLADGDATLLIDVRTRAEIKFIGIVDAVDANIPVRGARRMAESAALLVDEVLPEQPIRQWVLSFPFQLRFLFASCPELMGRVLGTVCRAISSHLIKKAGFTRKTAQTGVVTLIQRFGSALNLNVHFHMLFLDGVYCENLYGKTGFKRTNAPSQ